MSDNSREAFEKWITTCLYPASIKKIDDGSYADMRAYTAWEVWQASSAQKIEMILEFIGAIFVVLFPVLLWFLFILTQGN